MKTLLFLFLCSCGSPFATAARTIDAAAVFNRTTGEMMAELNEKTQDDIEERLSESHDWLRADKERNEWRGKRLKVRQAQSVLHAATVAASGSLVVAASVKDGKFNLNAALKPLLDAVFSLKDALSKFGIKLPLPGGF